MSDQDNNKENSSLRTFGEVAEGVGSAISGIAGAVAPFFGDDSQETGLSIPPEYELEFLKEFDRNMAELHQSYKQVSNLYDSYQQKISALDQIIQGGSTPERLQALQESNLKIATRLGGTTEDLIKGGFLSEDDRADLERMRNPATYTDPALENELKDRKARLEQDLRRQGAGPAAIAQALTQFDQSANEARFQRGIELSQQTGSVIGLRAGLRQQGFSQAMSGLEQNQSASMKAISLLSGNASSRFAGGLQAQSAQQGLRQEANQNFTTMGQFLLSDRTRGALESGLVGPGTFYEQTGVGGGALGDYRNWVATQERLASAGGSQEGYSGEKPDYSVAAYLKFKEFQRKKS